MKGFGVVKLGNKVEKMLTLMNCLAGLVTGFTTFPCLF